MNSDDLCDPTVVADIDAGAMVEGMADVIGAVYSQEHNLPGDDWVVGEHIFSNPQDSRIRDLRVNQSITDMSAPSLDPHENGKIFANAYYRLKNKGVSLTDVIKVLLETAKNVDRPGGLDPFNYDHKDFEEAFIAAAQTIGGSSLKSKAENVVSDMTPEPSNPNARAEQTACTGAGGSTATFTTTWWPGSGSPLSDYFEVERRIGSVWYPYYEGDPDCIPLISGAHIYLRVRAVNLGGQSGWTDFQGVNTCGSGGTGPF